MNTILFVIAVSIVLVSPDLIANMAIKAHGQNSSIGEEFAKRLNENLKIIGPKEDQYKADLINRIQNTTCLEYEINNNTESVLYRGRINITDLPTEYIYGIIKNCSKQGVLLMK